MLLDQLKGVDDMAQDTKTSTFKVGDEVSYNFGSDSYPAEVIAVSKSGHKVTVRQLEVMVVNGDYTGPQDYVTMSDENGSVYNFTRRERGHYQMSGANYARAPRLSHGARYYQDPSF